MYTITPASPLRIAFVLSVRSLPFNPSLPVGPVMDAPAVPLEPSRPSLPVPATVAAVLILSFTDCAKSTVIALPFAVVVT